MKRFFYIILFIFIIWLIIFIKPGFLPYKKYDCYNKADIMYFGNYKLNDFCTTLEDLYRIVSIDKKIEIIILPTWMYKFFAIDGSSDFYPNPINRYLWVNENVIEKTNKVILLEKLLSMKLIYQNPLLSYISIPTWKIRGYSWYLLNENSGFNINDICYNERKDEFGYDGFENNLVVRYLFEIRQYNEKSFFNDNLSYSVYLDESKRYYCK